MSGITFLQHVRVVKERHAWWQGYNHLSRIK